MDMLKATMNADLDDVGGRLRLTVFHNDLATPVADFTDNDILDEFEWQASPSLDQTFNVVGGVFTDPSNESLAAARSADEAKAIVKRSVRNWKGHHDCPNWWGNRAGT